MAGRFFRHLSDSDSESSESSEDNIPAKQVAPTSYILSDDDEDIKRVVRTAKEKRYEELHKIIKEIKNYKKNKDISKLLTSFENLTRAFFKARPVIDREENGVTPRFYIRCLAELETFVTDCWEDREGRKNMNKNNSKSLASLRQKLRKYTKDFESDLQSYRENPDGDEEEKDDEEDSEEKSSDESEDEFQSTKAKDLQKSDDEDEKKQEKQKPKAVSFLKGAEEEEDESDDSMWSSSEEEETSSTTDDEQYAGNQALRFLKKVGEVKETQKREKKAKEPKMLRRKEEGEDHEEGEWEQVKGGVITIEKPKMFAKDAEIDHQVMLKKLVEVLSMRGKKRIDRSDQIEMLTELRHISELNKLGPALEVKILFGIISSIFDYNSNVSSCMKSEMWIKCLETCQEVLDILTLNQDIAIGENIAEESEQFVTSPYRVHGCVLSLIERMDEEFTKMLQACDAHSPEYIDRLKDETKVCKVIDALLNYLELNGRGTSSELCRVYILKIDHVYYKFDHKVFKQKERKKQVENKENGETVNGEFKKVEILIEDSGEQKKEEVVEESEETSLDVMDRLCKFIYAKDTTDRIRTQAMLCHIYHHALHDNWFEARDLMLMSYLQHNITKSDIPLQIMYNRALVQLGLCAFRHGNIKDSHTALLDIQIQGRAKELLAQGLLPRQNERTPEQEKLEKRRQIPFHKHINLELLECVYLVSAMLLEIPDVASNEFSVRKKMISRSFYNQLRKNEEQPLVGLPESMREHVVAASKAMRVGNWKQCRTYIINEKMNGKVWNLFHQADKVREMLEQKIREESLRAYLFTYSHVYDSISMQILAEMFGLEKSTVHSIISKMIINEELMASLDEPTQSVVMHRTEPSRIQGLALQLADKINNLVEQNERLWEVKQGTGYGNTRMGVGDRQGYRDYGQGKQQDKGYQDRGQDRREYRDQRRGSQRYQN